jgi:lipoprotein-anchoring transpeptidase ErfK/SrfK
VEIERPAAGEKVSVEVDGERRSLPGTPIPANAGGGPLTASFLPRRTGVHRMTVEREGGARASTTVHAVDPRPHPGSTGLGVRLLQQGLRDLGYVTSSGGRYDAATGRAVLAYRKANGLARRTSAGRTVLGALFEGRGAYTVRYPRAGKHVEFDWSRQVLVLARGGRVERVYHASSGKASTPTVFGTFRFYRKQPGTNARGMVQSNYFIRGYAIHGYKSVPARPASHGCIRVPLADARSIDAWIHLGDRIFVFR